MRLLPRASVATLSLFSAVCLPAQPRDVVRNDADNGYTTAWVNSITFGHDIAGKLGGYVELASELRRGADVATFDFGFTYGLGKHVQLDAGANLGLTRAADDYNVFTGLSIRF